MDRSTYYTIERTTASGVHWIGRNRAHGCVNDKSLCAREELNLHALAGTGT